MDLVGRWHSSPSYFSNLGLDDPDELGLLLIDVYWRRYNQEPFAAEAMANEYP